MQLRVLDHRRLVESLHFPADLAGKVVAQVQESEGQISRFLLDYSAGRASARDTAASPDFICTDRVWAAVVSGDLKASLALQWGLAEGSTRAGELLDVLAVGPLPFCQEYF